MRNHTVRRLVLAAATFLVAVALSASANAGSLRQASVGGSAAVTGSLPGQVLWAYYTTTDLGGPCVDYFDPDGCNVGGVGDNIIRLINPNGSANPQIGGLSQPVCAMIYVFDDDEEMGECCGCPLTSAQLATFSVEQNLGSNWAVTGGPEGGEHGNGAIAIVAASRNVPVLFVPGLSNGQGCANGDFACNGGCDPTNTPGYGVTTANNLLGSITHNQIVQVGAINSPRGFTAITETALSDDAGGDPTNLTYLKNQCGVLVGNGTGGGICNCPLE
jgi:hypothetical protein